MNIDFLFGVVWPILVTIFAPIIFYIDRSKVDPDSAKIGAIVIFIFLAVVTFFFIRLNMKAATLKRSKTHDGA